MYERLTNFILRYMPQYKRKPPKLLRDCLKKHNQYKTLLTLYEGDAPVAVVRWNIEDKTAYVLDLIIDRRYRHRSLEIMRMFTRRALVRFPYLEHLKYNRSKDDRGYRTVEISRFLREK